MNGEMAIELAEEENINTKSLIMYDGKLQPQRVKKVKKEVLEHFIYELWAPYQNNQMI